MSSALDTSTTRDQRVRDTAVELNRLRKAAATSTNVSATVIEAGSRPIPVRIIASDVGRDATTGGPIFKQVIQCSAGQPNGRTVRDLADRRHGDVMIILEADLRPVAVDEHLRGPVGLDVEPDAGPVTHGDPRDASVGVVLVIDHPQHPERAVELCRGSVELPIMDAQLDFDLLARVGIQEVQEDGRVRHRGIVAYRPVVLDHREPSMFVEPVERAIAAERH